MRKFLLPLITVALVTLPALMALADEMESNIIPKTSLSEKSSSPAAAAPLALKPETLPALPAMKAQNVKIGTVDMTKIASDSSSGKAVYSEIKAKMEKIQKQIKSKEATLKKQKAAIEAQMPSLAPIQRSAKAKEFQKKLEDFQKFIQTAQSDIQNKEAALLKKLYKAVSEAANNYGSANGFAAIGINREFLFIGSTVETQDITSEIIKMIDNGKGK
jgi:outer membrane protein